MAKRDKTEDLVKEIIHEEDWKRMNATAELLKRGPEAVRHLLVVLTDENPRLRAEAALMLGRIKDWTAGAPIVKLLTDREPMVRTAAAEALQHVADDAALAALVRLLEEPEHRDTAAAVLGRLKDPGALEPLVAMLKSQDPTARRMAAEALEHLADPRSADAWIEAMGDPELRVIASRSLKRIAELRERIEDILNGLRGLEDTVALEEARVGVVMNLTALGRPAVSELLEALEDEHWMVREVAAQALGLIGDLRAVEPLLGKAKTDRDMGVRESCIKALGQFGDARAVAVLVEAVNVPTTRLAASEGLSKIKDINVLVPHIELIKRMRADRDGLVSYHGGLILEKLDKLMSEQGIEKKEDTVLRDEWDEEVPAPAPRAAAGPGAPKGDITV
jgi:HEAT repeat protein